MSWQVAPAIKAMFEEANRLWPERSKRSDGTIGDAAHRNRKSDHNPNAQGYVMAGDLTHDPAHGVDCNVLAEKARVDPRTKYVIWNRRIANPSIQGGAWRPYSGSNPHDKHMHVSVIDSGRNITAPWFSEVNAMTDKPVHKSGSDVAGIAATPTGKGYWIVTVKGEVFSFGDAGYFGRVAAPN